jgi:hypothetical protein
MLLLRVLNDLTRLLLKLPLTLHEFFALLRDLGASSRESADFLIEEEKSKSFSRGPNQSPGFSIGHAHLMRSLVQGVRFICQKSYVHGNGDECKAESET